MTPPEESVDPRFALAELLPHMVWVARADGAPEYFNRRWREFTGLSAAEVADLGWDRVTHPDDMPRALEVWHAGVRSGDPFEVEFRLRRHDGVYRWHLSRGQPERDPDGAVVRVAGTCTDVTDRKRLEEELRHAAKLEAVGRLAGGVAHDFNNLVTVINGFSDLALDNLPGNHAARSMVEEVRKAAGRAADLTRQLLAFGRKQLLQPQVLDLGRLAADLGGMLRRVLGEDVTLDLDPRPVHVSADPGQLSQVLMNLAVNARDAMPQGGRLDVNTRAVTLGAGTAQDGTEVGAGEYALLEVADSGCGMTEEVLARIFEPFFTTKEVGKGTGLGLATAYGIVRQSGGHIGVETAVGRGTTFRVYLPAAAPVGDPRPAPAEAAEPAAPGVGAILLVEDDDQVRTLAMRVLQRAGYVVVDAPCGKRALETVAVFRLDVDLLVTDVVMPGMGGRELADRLSPARPGLKVLFVSGYTDDAVLRHGVEQDAVHFLQKPYAPAALVAKVREMLEAGR